MPNNTVELETTRCPIGCPEDDELVLCGSDRLNNLPGSFSLVRCKYCGLMRTNPRPTQETISYYYPDSYGPYLGSKVSVDAKPILWKRFLRRLIKLNDIIIPLIKPGRMLEIGCSAGSFLHRMSEQGWSVEGIELSHKAATEARSLGYNVHVGVVEDAPEPKILYDIVVGWMVVEHLHDPVAVLKKLNSWTKPEGWLAISVPNAGSLEFNLFGNYWYALQLPTHLYHYTPSTIVKMLTVSGWEVDKIMHQKNLNNIFPSIGYFVEDHLFTNRFTKWLIQFSDKPGIRHILVLPFAWIASCFGQTGRMTIWARKTD